MKYLPLILFITAIISCNTKKQEPESLYFEGTVEFNISYTSKDPAMITILKKTFGSRAITYISKKGYFARDFIDSNNIIIGTEIYRPDSLRVYSFTSNYDTIRYTEAKEQNNSKVVEVVKNDPLKILNHVVDKVRARAEMEGITGNGPFYVYTTYYNDVNYLINPLAYKNVKADNVENIFSASPHITIGVVFEYGNIATATSTAIRITPSTLQDWHFNIPKNRIIAKQNR